MAAGRKTWLGAALVCAAATVVCVAWLAMPPDTSPTPPAPTVPVSTEAAQRFEEELCLPSAGEFSIQASEEEVTSYIALRLHDTVPLAGPQVRFLPGRFVLEGDLTGPVHSYVRVVGTATAVDGRPQITLESAHLGNLTMPRTLLASIADSLLEAISADSTYLGIQSIELAEKSIAISGCIREP